MRLNRLVAGRSGLSRRAADEAIKAGRVTVDGKAGALGQIVSETEAVELDDQPLVLKPAIVIMLNKPVGYVCSREGQGAKTIYELLPPEYQELKSVGRLDKDSSGLLLLTNDGELSQRLMHPSQEKSKTYVTRLNRRLEQSDLEKLEQGVNLDDGISRLGIRRSGQSLIVTISEGRNRQIRRSFQAVGYKVASLHRTAIGSLELGDLAVGQVRIVDQEELS